MEMFGILFSIPASFVASLVYCFLLATFVVPRETLRRLMWRLSLGVLIAFGAEVLLLFSLGAVRARGLLGPGFYAGHLVLFFLGTPALANVLVLRRSHNCGVRWYAAVPFCVVFALVLVLLQYVVSEALYGVDGDTGPYSKEFALIDGNGQQPEQLVPVLRNPALRSAAAGFGSDRKNQAFTRLRDAHRKADWHVSTPFQYR